MSSEIKVNPETIKSAAANIRNIPADRIDSMLTKIEELNSTLESWKGNGKPAHDEVCSELQSSLEKTKILMEAIITSLDLVIDNFQEMDYAAGESYKK